MAECGGEGIDGVLLFGGSEQVDDDFGVAGGVEEVAALLELVAEEVGVDKVAVVSDGDLPADVGLDEGLCIAGHGTAGGGVAVVGDRAAGGVLLEMFECSGVEDLGDEAHAGDADESFAVGDGDAGGLLPAVLLRVGAGIDERGGVRRAPDADDTAFFLGVVGRQRPVGRGREDGE